MDEHLSEELPTTSKNRDTIAIDADDSSDEEDSKKPARPFRDFLRETHDSLKTIDVFVRELDPEGYTFKVFTLALEYLYSENVNDAYYAKKKSLEKSSAVVKKDKLTHFFTDILMEAIKPCFDINPKETFSDKYRLDFWEKNEAAIIDIIDSICTWTKQHPRIFLLSIRERNANFFPYIEKHIDSLRKLIRSYIETIDEEPEFPYHKLLPNTETDVFNRNVIAHFLYDIHKLSKIIILTRGLLPQQHTLTTQSPTEHLANVRLAMRVQRRRIRQCKADYPAAVFEGEEFQLAWKFHTHTYVVLEKQEITKNGGRNDLVQNLSTYKKIFKTLQNFMAQVNAELLQKKKSPINDPLVALWLRDILISGTLKHGYKEKDNFVRPLDDISDGLKKAFLQFLINLSYLLLGCEVQRNPASLIVHQMAIDLIGAEKMTLEQAFADPAYGENCGGGALPMTMGAYKIDKSKFSATPVATARLIDERYSQFSSKKWVYDGESSATTPSKHRHIKEFIRREHDVIKFWSQFKSEQRRIAGKPFNLDKEICKSLARRWYPAKK